MPTTRMVLPILGGSAMEFQTQKAEERSLCVYVLVEGPDMHTSWSKVEQDLKLESYPHTHSLVIRPCIACTTGYPYGHLK